MKKSTAKNSLMTRAALILLILILPFNIIGIATALFSYENSAKNARTAVSYTLDSAGLLLRNKVDNTVSLLYKLIDNNPDLISMNLSKSDSDYAIYRYRLTNSVLNQIRSSDVADTVFLYLSEKDDYIQIPGFTGDTIGSRPHFSYIENYSRDMGKWFLSEDCTQLIRILYVGNMDYYIGVVIDLTKFLTSLKDLQGFPSLTYSFGTEEASAASGRLAFSRSLYDGVFLCAEISTDDLNSSIGVLQYALILVFFLCLALIPLLFLLMRKNVGNPLHSLIRAHEELQGGNENYRIEETAHTREFEEVFSSFNDMATSLQLLQKEVLEKELANKQLQIDYLQLQIRPHFLLNSFNLLYTLAQRNQREPAQEMILFLSNYFRYLFRSGNELQLFAKERKLIEDYMEISKISYPVSFEVSYQLDPILDQMRVPPLLLHSFMENIIAHALLPGRVVHIVFSGVYEDGLAVFYISDDGKGISPEALSAINRIEDRPVSDGENVGIRNSILRLRYYYGETAHVECDSELNVGTTFTITIPYNLEDT